MKNKLNQFLIKVLCLSFLSILFIPAQLMAICGDLVIDVGEDCDNGNILQGDFVLSGSGGLSSPRGLAFGPDGNLYLVSNFNNEVLRYDGATGVFFGTFVTSGSGGLNGPQGLTFGPDGNLYISSGGSDAVLRYDGITGAFIDEFVTPGSGGLNGPEGLAFGADGHLYVANSFDDEILRYDGTTGVALGSFVIPGSGGLDDLEDITFGPDGNLYVSSYFGDEVLRYDGTTGDFIDVFMDISSPRYLVFFNGVLYASSSSGDKVIFKAIEVLEGGNSDEANAMCRLDCRAQRCGDGIIDDAFGETCEGGASCDPVTCQALTGMHLPGNSGGSGDPDNSDNSNDIDESPSPLGQSTGGCSLNSLAVGPFLNFAWILAGLGLLSWRRLVS